MSELEQLIATRISETGPISFAEFMELALYHPQLGYYCSDREKLGWQGDFYTSCTMTPVFGETVAAQILEMWQLSGIGDLTLVEFGAGNGDLCRSVLGFFEKEKDLPGSLQYVIIEISASLRELQRSRVPSSVRWIGSIGELSGFSGIVISNELLDNFPVHRVQMSDELMEIRVDHSDRFTEVTVPASERLKQYFSDLGVVLPKGFRAEVCLYAEKWVQDIAAAMRSGFLLTIDYGYLAGELFSDRFKDGTLVSYSRHRVKQDVYSGVGTRDISSHVNFSVLALFGHNNGFGLTGFRDQGPFLRALGFEKRLVAGRGDGDPVSATRHENTVLQTVLGDMGSRFKVLCLQKGLPPLRLSGFSGPGPS